MTAYRRLGADPPFADLRRAHGVPMEGWYWRLTDPEGHRSIVALCGVCRDQAGTWALVALAADPDRLIREAIAETAVADTDRFGLSAGDSLAADARRLSVDLGPGARLEATFAEPVDWPRRAFGGLGPAHWLPGLPQYWHPHLLGARVGGEARLGDERVCLDGWHAYAEKNWGRGFPGRWWWGQAHGFERDDVCVAFAGGELARGLSAGAIVVRVGDDLVRLSPPTAIVRANVDGSGWRLRGRGPRHSVEVEGEATDEPYALPVPVPSERRFERRASQQLAGRLRVRVRRGRTLVLDDESSIAGLELGGPGA